MMNDHKSLTGFTLVEMMVTVSIMAVVSSIVALNIIGQLPAWRLKQAQYQVLSDFRRARMESVARGINARITMNQSAETYSIWLDLNRNGNVDSGEQTTASIATIAGISWSCYPTTMTFKPNGTMSSSYSYQYVYIYNAAQYRYVYSFPSGQVDPWPQEG